MIHWLTEAPITKKIRETEWEELSMLCEDASLALVGKIKCYRTAGTTETYTYNATAVGKRFYFIVMKPTAETFADLDYMEAWLETNSEQTTTKRIYLCDKSEHKTRTRIGWLNYLGGIDYYTFYGQKSTEAIVERVLYRKDLPLGYSSHDRGIGVLSSVYSEETEVISDFETPETMAWLVMVMASPEVWIMEGESGNQTLLPITITSKNQVIETGIMVQMKLKYRKANDIFTQNG
jgi:hypothetical protein